MSTDVAALRARWVERVRPAARAAALEPQHAGPVARSALGGLFAALRLPGGRAPPGSPLAAVEACDAALERGDVVGALAALDKADGDLALSVRDWRRDGVVRRRADGPRARGAVGARGGAARGVSNAAFILLLVHEFTRRCYRQPPGRPIGERAG